MVVPDHNLIWRVLWVRSTANESQNFTPKKHLDNADAAATAIEVSAKDLAEWIAIVDPEAMINACGEAAVVLVEGEVEKRGRRNSRRNHLGWGRKWGVEIRASVQIQVRVRVRVRRRVMLHLMERFLVMVGLVSWGKEIKVRVRARARARARVRTRARIG